MLCCYCCCCCCRFEEALLEERPSPEQAERVRGLFHRQLAVPLADGGETMEAYRLWEQGQAGEGAPEFQVCAGGC